MVEKIYTKLYQDQLLVAFLAGEFFFSFMCRCCKSSLGDWAKEIFNNYFLAIFSQACWKKLSLHLLLIFVMELLRANGRAGVAADL